MASPEPDGRGTPRRLTMEAARAESGPDVHIVGVIGSPVAHSLSPLLHNSAFAALGLGDSWRSFAFEVAARPGAGRARRHAPRRHHAACR